MWGALGHIVPIALAVAFSSVPVTAAILIVLSANRNRSALAFLLGWVAGLAVTLVAFTALSRYIPARVPQISQNLIGLGLIVIGVAVLILAVVLWLRKPRPSKNGVPKWLLSVTTLGPVASFGLAFVMNLRPKGILLSAAAGLSIRGDRLDPVDVAILIAVYTVVAGSSVALPIVASLVNPRRTEIVLNRVRGWISRNSKVLSVVILVLVGLVIIVDGLTRL